VNGHEASGNTVIWTLLIVHAVMIVAIAFAPQSLGRWVFGLAALPPSATTVWAFTMLGDEKPALAERAWVSGLDLSLRFEVDALAGLMTLLVSGIGAAVFVYAAGYFSAGAEGLNRFASTLLAFSAAMLGLVWSDSVWTLFLFWELTSITSFLLVGFKNTYASSRYAARRALVITVAGGLSLLGGLVVLVDQTGTAVLSEMEPVTGAGATVAAILLLAAAATKSAQFPFHVWLPGAMEAPTPVSAYLHSATMVKAGVFLIALAAPVLDGIESWKWIGLGFGVITMFWGAIGALRHVDAKLILAWGTVSQLGFMVTLLAMGTGKATFAAISIVFAHAIFKAALFMVVGEVDARTGTRDIRELGGLMRSMPLAFTVAVVSGLSMAGFGPILGFAAKEAAIEGALKVEGTEGMLLTILIVGGASLTVAYTLRFLVGVFGPGPAVEVAVGRPAMAIPAGLLGLASVVLFFMLGWVNGLVRPAAVLIDPEAVEYSLKAWPGITTAFLVSTGLVVGGALIGVFAMRLPIRVPRTIGADLVDALIDNVVVVSKNVAARIQHGSLPVYVATMAFTAAVAITPFWWSIDTDVIYRWDRPAQAVLAVVAVASAVVAAALGSRLGAALGLGFVGLAVTGIFVAHGAPDLAITQVLVETVVVVGFVFGLGHLARRFPPVGGVWRSARLAVAAFSGVAVMVALAASASAPTGEPPTDELVAQAVDQGGGNNVVNVILTDVRALDTLGEVVVLLVVSVGVLSLSRARSERTPA
jgi:multicomponent Na+:H+ antiporter subunit A